MPPSIRDFYDILNQLDKDEKEAIAGYDQALGKLFDGVSSGDIKIDERSKKLILSTLWEITREEGKHRKMLAELIDVVYTLAGLPPKIPA